MVQRVASGSIEAQLQGEFSGQVIVGHHNVQIHAEHGALVNVLPEEKLPVPRPRPVPVLSLRPRPFPGLLDRQAEVGSVLAAFPSAQPVEIYGEAGIGKTALLRHLAHHPEAGQFSDGIVFRSALNQPLADLFQFLFDAFYECDVPFKPTDTQVRLYLQNKRALVLLDDLGLTREEVEGLINDVPSCAFVVASSERRLWGEAQAIAVSGLPVADALTLVERALGRELTDEERDAAQALCAALDCNPLRIQQGSAEARDRRRSLLEIAQKARAALNPQEQTEQALATLSESEWTLLRTLAAMGGASVHSEHLAAMMGLPTVGHLLQSLQQRSLVQVHESRYRLAGDLAGVLEKREDLTPHKERALAYFLAWAERNRKTPARLLEEADAIQNILGWATATGRWAEVQQLGRAFEGALTLGGRWEAWQQVLNSVLAASRKLKDKAGEGWALHQLGTRALCLTDRSAALDFLHEALALRDSLGDQTGAAVTRHNLNIILGPAPPPDDSSKEPGYARPKFGPLKGALFLGPILLLVGLLSYLLWPAPASSLVISASRLDFPDQRPGSSSEARTVTLTNKGSEPLVVQSVNLVGDDADHFTLRADDCLRAPIAPGGSCSIGVAFAPKAAGSRSVKLRIVDNVDKGPRIVPLSGNGVIIPSVIASNPGSLNFGDQGVGTRSKEQTVTLNNGGTLPLEIRDIEITGPNSADFDINTNCVGQALAPGSGCTVGIIFTPVATGSSEASLVITDQFGESLMAAPLAGVGTTSLISFSPVSLSFGNQEVGAKAEARSVEITNTGTAPLTVNKVMLTGPSAGSFTVSDDNCSRAAIAPGQNCTIRVSFSPRDAGDYKASLTISDNTSDKTHNLLLNGTGTAPGISLSSNSLDFGRQAVRDTNGEPRTLRVTNSGSAPLRINNVTLGGGGEFVITANECAQATIAPGNSCAVSIKFIPRVVGNRTASLSIANNASGGPQTVRLSGIATPPPKPLFSPSPSALNFGPQEINTPSRAQTVTITNRGSAELAIRDLSLAGGNAGDFNITNENCTRAAIGPGGDCSISITFTPRGRLAPGGSRDRRRPGTESAPERRASLTVTDNGDDSPHSISLSGTVAPPRGRPAAALSPPNLDFGNQEVGTESEARQVKLTNNGSAPLEINSVRITGASQFSIKDDGCARATIGPGESCTVSVRFAPRKTGSQSASLAVTDNADDSPQSVRLSGTGIKDLWCCSDGEVFQGSADECRRRRGSVFESKKEAEKKCRPDKPDKPDEEGKDDNPKPEQARGWCCRLGRVYQTTEEECGKRLLRLGPRGFFSLDEGEVRRQCAGEQPGWCCNDGQVTLSSKGECRGFFSTNRREAQQRCRPPEQQGWCCSNGEVIQSSQSDCARRRGFFSEDRATAAKRCEQQDSGWCCKNATVTRSSRQNCARVEGTFFKDQKQALDQCTIRIR